jgi:hypothetical protein
MVITLHQFSPIRDQVDTGQEEKTNMSEFFEARIAIFSKNNKKQNLAPNAPWGS